MRIQTEKATDRWDLPHTVEIANMAALLCRCGRKSEDELHRPVLTEQASHADALITEKGI